MELVTNKRDNDGNPMVSLCYGETSFHIDKSYVEKPHRASFLYALEVPPEGGHTKFASLYGAWNNLPDELKQRLEGKRIMQGYDYGCDSRLNLDINLDNIFHFSQPLVGTNPGSGRKARYVAPRNSRWVEEIGREGREDPRGHVRHHGFLQGASRPLHARSRVCPRAEQD